MLAVGLLAWLPGTVSADVIYRLEALSGVLLSSHVSGSLTLPDEALGQTEWDLTLVIALQFNLASSAEGEPEYSWDRDDLVMAQHPVRFDAPIGDPVLVPALPDAAMGSPDWLLISGNAFLGLGTDAVKSLWTFGLTDSPGFLDWRPQAATDGTPQWQLVLVPEAGTFALLGAGLGLAALFPRRRARHSESVNTTIA